MTEPARLRLSGKPLLQRGQAGSEPLDLPCAPGLVIHSGGGGKVALDARRDQRMGVGSQHCGDRANPGAGGPDLAAGLEATPDAIIELLAGMVVRPADHAAVASFKAMARRVGAQAGAAQARAVASRDDILPRLGELTMPALIMSGDEDPIAPPACGHQLAQAMPKAHFELMPQCGHLPTLEQPAQAAALFQAFLGKHPQQFGHAITA